MSRERTLIVRHELGDGAVSLIKEIVEVLRENGLLGAGKVVSTRGMEGNLKLVGNGPLPVQIEDDVQSWISKLKRMKRTTAYLREGPEAVRECARFCKWHSAADANPRDIEGWLNSKTGVGGTMNNRLSYISAFFNYCHKTLRRVETNPTDGVERAPRESGDGSREFTPSEAEAVIQAANGHWRVACAIMRHTALRKGAVFKSREGRHITCGMFNAKSHTLDIPKGTLKNRKDKRVMLNKTVYDIIAEAVKDRPLEDPIVPIMYDWEIWLALLKRAGVAYKDERGRVAGTHSFRKGVGAELVEKDVPLKVLKEILGHTDIRVTDRIYSKLRDDRQREAVQILEKSQQLLIDGGDETRYLASVKPASPTQDQSTTRRRDDQAGFTNTHRCGARSSGHVSLTGTDGPTNQAVSETPRLGLEPSRGERLSGEPAKEAESHEHQGVPEVRAREAQHGLLQLEQVGLQALRNPEGGRVQQVQPGPVSCNDASIPPEAQRPHTGNLVTEEPGQAAMPRCGEQRNQGWSYDEAELLQRVRHPGSEDSRAPRGLHEAHGSSVAVPTVSRQEASTEDQDARRVKNIMLALKLAGLATIAAAALIVMSPVPQVELTACPVLGR